MKKSLCLFLCLALMLAMAGCGGESSSGKPGNQPVGVNDVLEQGMAKADSKSADNSGLSGETSASNDQKNTGEKESSSAAEPAVAETSAESSASETSEEIDVDLTILSSTMVYSEVYNMMTDPKEYIGKTIKMNGTFSYYHDESTGNEYFACIIKDATACCAQGIEFVLDGDYSYPKD